MPVSTAEASTGADGFIFPDDLEGTRFRLVRDALYTAYEVRVEEHGEEVAVEDDYEAHEAGQVPAYGRWYPVERVNGDGEEWMIAPGELIDELKTWEDPADAGFRVSRCQKSGPDPSDPYEVNVAPDPDA